MKGTLLNINIYCYITDITTTNTASNGSVFDNGHCFICRVGVISKQYKGFTDKVEKWYGTEYSVEDIKHDLLEVSVLDIFLLLALHSSEGRDADCCHDSCTRGLIGITCSWWMFVLWM